VETSELVKRVRRDAGLSVRALGKAAGIAASTVHRIEQGAIHPTVDVVERIAEAAGTRLVLEARPDYAASALGLARAIRDDLSRRDDGDIVRKAAELAQRFVHADVETRERMIAADPPSTGDPQWEAFVGALAEWLAASVGQRAPEWTRDERRFLDHGWWVTPLKSMQAWEYAGAPIAFKRRGVYLHRDSLTNV
jgi:transcriptional regulator with XRE-family HTH domain